MDLNMSDSLVACSNPLFNVYDYKEQYIKLEIVLEHNSPGYFNPFAFQMTFVCKVNLELEIIRKV